MDMPVYLFTGFLESGKTKFIQETLEDERFNAGERTLLLVCEEGEEEYDPSKFAGKNVVIRTVDEVSELNEQNLTAWVKESKAVRVMIEYNGMWMLTDLYNAFPDKWSVYQELMFADTGTFLNYNANMRSLVVDKLQSAELVIFNRYDSATDKMDLHKIVRGVSRNAAIVYEYKDGSTEEDTIEDPLPFDIDADVVEIADKDYAVWYRDMNEELMKYNGKTVKFKGVVAKDKKLEANTFVVGRHVMTCCVEDIQYAGLVAVCSGSCPLATEDWVIVTAELSVEYHKLYRGKGPVLKVKDIARTTAPEEKVVSF